MPPHPVGLLMSYLPDGDVPVVANGGVREYDKVPLRDTVPPITRLTHLLLAVGMLTFQLTSKSAALRARTKALSWSKTERFNFYFLIHTASVSCEAWQHIIPLGFLSAAL